MKNPHILCVIFLSLFLFAGCGETEPGKKVITNDKAQNAMKNTNIAPKEVIKLIEDLNYWVSVGGDPEHPVGNLKSTGESHSKFLDIKEEILKRKIEIKWEGDKYVLTNPEEKKH